MPPILVLTRPEPQSRALAAALDVPVQVIVAPIMEIVCAETAPDLASYAGVILTSANAVRCGPVLVGCAVHCVGERTASAARAAGAAVLTVARDADDLVSRVTGPGPLLHLRGEHARGDVARRLIEAGIPTEEAVAYAQKPLPLSAEARAALEGVDPAVLPLFSPRSAQLVGANLQPGPDLCVIAMSPAVARAWLETTGGVAQTVAAPTGDSMRAAIVAALRRDAP